MSKGDLVALTGGTGFVGSHIADALLAAGYRVRALVRRPESPGWLKGTGVEIVKGDVRDPATLPDLVRDAAAVVHVAGKTSARSEAEYMAANAGGTKNVAAAVRERAPRSHFVLVSSQAAGGPSAGGAPVKSGDTPRPVSTYGRSKLAGEEALRRAGVPFTILRPSGVYGPRETAIRDLFVAASKGLVPVLAGGLPRIQLVFAEDVAVPFAERSRGEGRARCFSSRIRKSSTTGGSPRPLPASRRSVLSCCRSRAPSSGRPGFSQVLFPVSERVLPCSTRRRRTKCCNPPGFATCPTRKLRWVSRFVLISRREQGGRGTGI